jgi:hypothetical protein
MLVKIEQKKAYSISLQAAEVIGEGEHRGKDNKRMLDDTRYHI